MVLSQGLVGKFDPALQSCLDHVTLASCRFYLGIFENSQHVLPQVIAAAALERNLRVGAHRNPSGIICKPLQIVRYSTMGILADFYPRVLKIQGAVPASNLEADKFSPVIFPDLRVNRQTNEIESLVSPHFFYRLVSCK